jgi:2-methylisocitrate lyase-like PEP mutase family enzyme
MHDTSRAFVVPNPWDAGSARLLQHLGFKAIATTSAGLAFSHGRPDMSLPRELLMRHLADVTAAVDLPVSADLESGFGERTEEVVATVLMAAEAGVVGGSLEDSTGDAQRPLMEIALAAERVRAAAEAVRSLPFPFVLTARAENFFVGRPDLRDTIRRLQAYQEAGADVLYAPGLKSTSDIRTLVCEVDRPVNVLIGFAGMTLGLRELEALGVRRISVGGSLARTAIAEFLCASTELLEHGTATYSETAASGQDLNRVFSAFQ